MFVANYGDRVNIGFAQDQLRADVGISAVAFGFGAGLFLGARPAAMGQRSRTRPWSCARWPGTRTVRHGSVAVRHSGPVGDL